MKKAFLTIQFIRLVPSAGYVFSGHPSSLG